MRIKASTNKDARIQYKQAVLYIQLLQDNGTRLPENVTKHLGDGIWELRPGNNRNSISTLEMTPLFFSINSAKSHQKTPRREIDKDKAERDDYLSRKEAEA